MKHYVEIYDLPEKENAKEPVFYVISQLPTTKVEGLSKTLQP